MERLGLETPFPLQPPAMMQDLFVGENYCPLLETACERMPYFGAEGVFFTGDGNDGGLEEITAVRQDDDVLLQEIMKLTGGQVCRPVVDRTVGDMCSPTTAPHRRRRRQPFQCDVAGELGDVVDEDAAGDVIDRKLPSNGNFQINFEEYHYSSKRPRPEKSNQTTSTSNIDFRRGGHNHDDAVEAVAQVKEMIYRAAAFRPVWLGAEAAVERPRRRNVRISTHPQTVAARHRRERISERLRVLQRLVPGGSKLDTASMLDEAANYLKFLKSQVCALEALGKSLCSSFTGAHTTTTATATATSPAAASLPLSAAVNPSFFQPSFLHEVAEPSLLTPQTLIQEHLIGD